MYAILVILIQTLGLYKTVINTYDVDIIILIFYFISIHSTWQILFHMQNIELYLYFQLNLKIEQ